MNGTAVPHGRHRRPTTTIAGPTRPGKPATSELPALGSDLAGVGADLPTVAIESGAHRRSLDRDRNRTRRDRSRRHLITGSNGKPYALDEDGEDTLPHGEESTYTNRLCRCDPCGEANSAGRRSRSPKGRASHRKPS